MKIYLSVLILFFSHNVFAKRSACAQQIAGLKEEIRTSANNLYDKKHEREQLNSQSFKDCIHFLEFGERKTCTNGSNEWNALLQHFSGFKWLKRLNRECRSGSCTQGCNKLARNFKRGGMPLVLDKIDELYFNLAEDEEQDGNSSQ